MPGFFSCHTVAQLSEQAVRERAEHLTAATVDEAVNLVRTVCDLDAARMLCEWVAPDRESVQAYLREHDMEPSGEGEWLMHVDVEQPSASPPIELDPKE